MKPSLAQTMKEKLMLPGFESKSPVAARMSDPIVDTPMLLTLDETCLLYTSPSPRDRG